MASRLSSFFSELKRRKVYHVGAVYFAVAVGVFGLAEPVLGQDAWEDIRIIVVAMVLVSFPIALVLAWAYEVRPEEPRPSEPSQEEARLAPGLEARATIRTAGDRKSIVVLPFDNMSPDQGDAYFADGLTEEIITHLSCCGLLRVISRNSAMVLKGTQKSTRAIAGELDVQYVLEGSVRKAGTDLRITAQLIDAGRDEHLWTDTYDGTIEDVFRIQEQTARSIADALRLSLSPEEEQRLSDRPIEDVQAYQCYLMARRDFSDGTAEGLRRAQLSLENGLQIIGENVALLQGLAEVQLYSHEIGFKAGEETLREAEDLADRIFALQPDSAPHHYIRGRIERFRGSFVEAIGHFEHALACDPTHANSLLFLSHSYALQVGRAEFAQPQRKMVLEQDPLNFMAWFMTGIHAWMSGDLELALSNFQQAGELGDASRGFAGIMKAYLLIWQQRRDEALVQVNHVVQREDPGLLVEWGTFLGRALEGAGALPSEALSEETKRYLWNDPEFMWLGTSTFALGGEKEEALNWLEHIVDRGWINYPLLSKRDPLLESLRGEERYKKLMLKVKGQWEAFGAQLNAHA